MNLFTDEKIMPNSKEGFHKQLLCMLSMIRWEKQTKKRRISAAFSLSYSQNAEDRMNLFTDENVMPSTLLKIKEGFAVMPQNNHLWFHKEQFLKELFNNLKNCFPLSFAFEWMLTLFVELEMPVKNLLFLRVYCRLIVN